MTNHRLKTQAFVAAVCFLISFFGRAEAQQPSTNEKRLDQKITSSSFFELLKLANERTRSGQWNEAAELWSRVSELNPVEGDVWDQLAQARYQNKDYRRAIPAFQKALELGAGFPCNQAYSIARCYSMLENKGRRNENGLRRLTILATAASMPREATRRLHRCAQIRVFARWLE